MRFDIALPFTDMRPSPNAPRPAPLSTPAGWLRLCALLCAFVLASATAPAAWGQIYVDHAATGANNGSSWTDAYTHLQDALDNATGSDQIWIAQGTYYPDEGPDVNNDDPSASFTITGDQDGLRIYGGFAGDENNLSERDLSAGHETILSGNIGTPDNASDNSFHVVVMDGGYATGIGEDVDANITTDTELNGVTITGGNASGSGENKHGGGLYCDGNGNSDENDDDDECSPTLAHVVFDGNKAEDGGAIYNNAGGGHKPLRNQKLCFFRK